MLIECLTKREGPTRFNLHGFPYEFKANEHGHAVCQVNSREHREYLLSMPADFREYQPPQPQPALPEEIKVGNGKRAYRKRKTTHPG